MPGGPLPGPGPDRIGAHIKGLNRPLILLNLLFLGCIAFLPYPTSLLSAADDQVPATIFYAAAIAATGLVEAAVWLYAIFSALVLRRLEPPEADPGTAERDDLPG